VAGYRQAKVGAADAKGVHLPSDQGITAARRLHPRLRDPFQEHGLAKKIVSIRWLRLLRPKLTETTRFIKKLDHACGTSAA